VTRARWLRRLGPGLVTGASDDDPSGIGTYAQAGAAFGFGFLWTMLFTFPLMSAVQAISARIGRATGRGLTRDLREHHAAWVAYAAMGALVVANVVNVGADLVAMGESARLVAGGPAWAWAVGLAILSLTLQVLVPYRRYQAVLKWLTLSLLAYVALAFTLSVPWREVAFHALVPQMGFDKDSIAMLVAILGTTISPYLFFWQADQEKEEMHERGKRPLARAGKRETKRATGRIAFDTIVGMLASNLIAFFIILGTAATLHAHGQTDVQSADQAAQALQPLAGRFAFLLFALGIVGTGLLAVPVLAGSVGYACGEAFGWRASLDAKPWRAPKFYAMIAAASLAGLAILLLRVSPIQALVWTAILNGVAAVPILALVVRMSGKRAIMGDAVAPAWLRALGWLTAALMGAAAVAMVATRLR
jgi:NRAMP (natural resistance-associated macrophage protein)-like metal ion transporter